MSNWIKGSIAFALAIVLRAQQPATAPLEAGTRTVETHATFAFTGPGALLQGGSPMEGIRKMSMEYIASESAVPGKVVTGAPYSAQAVTETTQALADGNRIHRATTSQMYRDSEGRTRREPAFACLDSRRRPPCRSWSS